MAVLPIVTYPDPVLSKTCESIKVIDQQMVELSEDMAETMFGADSGIGLAAPQVGRSVRLVVVDSDPEGERGTPLALFNPRIIEKSGCSLREEGCLSLPGHFAEVERCTQVVVEAEDKEGKTFRMVAEGLLARCLQHELDHLEGKLVVDYVSPLKRALYRKRCLKEKKKAQG